jgi:predicted nucleic acid-binding protein
MIWYLRGHSGARRFLEGVDPIRLSAVTYMELVQGMRDKHELTILRRALSRRKIPVLSIDEHISGRAVLYVEEHFLAHSLRLADALIAATAVEHGLPLATANVKHYRVVQELEIELFRP